MAYSITFAHLFVGNCLEINVASKNKGFIKMPAKTAFFSARTGQMQDFAFTKKRLSKSRWKSAFERRCRGGGEDDRR
jgi:hypothetical protein